MRSTGTKIRDWYFFVGRDTSAGQKTRERRGRPGLTGKTRRTYRRGYPAANSLSRIFVRIGYRLNGLPFTIPDSMPGSLDCAAGDCNPLLFRRHHLPKEWRREPFYRLRNSSYHRNATHAGQQDFRRRGPVGTFFYPDSSMRYWKRKGGWLVS